MPKTTITFESEDKIPEVLKPFANGLTVEVWANANDLAVAGELNPTLEASRNTILGEKNEIKQKHDALLAASSDKAKDLAEYIIENDSLKKRLPSDDDAKLLTSVKNIFKDKPIAEIETTLPTLLEASSKVAEYEKREKQKELFKHSGYKSKKVFLDMINNPANMAGIEGDLYVETVADSDKKALFAKVKDANGVIKPVQFSEYVKDKEAWQTYMPSLMNGTQADPNQQWFQQQPQIVNPQDQNKPAWQQVVEKQNKTQETKINPFQPNSTVQTGASALQGNQQQ